VRVTAPAPIRDVNGNACTELLKNCLKIQLPAKSTDLKSVDPEASCRFGRNNHQISYWNFRSSTNSLRETILLPALEVAAFSDDETSLEPLGQRRIYGP
jgi:hypothetical protein